MVNIITLMETMYDLECDAFVAYRMLTAVSQVYNCTHDEARQYLMSTSQHFMFNNGTVVSRYI